MQSCSSPGPLAPNAMPQSAGRPRALTNSKRSEIIKLITEGLALENAAKHVGCSVRTIRREMKRDPTLADVVRSSQNVALLNSLRTVLHACQDDWRPAKWLLERQFPELFAGRGQNSAFGKRQIRQLLHEVLQIANDEAIDANQRERLNGRIRVAFEYLTHVYCAPNRSSAGLRRATKLFEQKDKQNDSFADLEYFTNLSTNDHCSQNRRGLAHFAESSEQNVPVPLSADGSGMGSKAGVLSSIATLSGLNEDKMDKTPPRSLQKTS